MAMVTGGMVLAALALTGVALSLHRDTAFRMAGAIFMAPFTIFMAYISLVVAR